MSQEITRPLKQLNFFDSVTFNFDHESLLEMRCEANNKGVQDNLLSHCLCGDWWRHPAAGFNIINEGGESL